ncbi:GTP pyrophosphokinase [Bacillus toyonensis]|uniref:GTP pyrophosphokinase n=1 Tax=Bacillus toyonensis TaxID=155322 RepID=UPI000BFCEA38|nr:GTP pyrophosphokinase [Bacillus toyonensis]PHE64122.1 GTP pyrophosphokinase [Bacillus toyonensis]
MIKIEHFISEINRIHLQFSEDYFETGESEKYNLSRTISKVPLEHILDYRLSLHESINDYLMEADLGSITYFYRVKTTESIEDKLKRYSERESQYPVNGWLNDLFGCRLLLDSDSIEQIENVLDDWKEKYGLKNWYKKDKDGYKGIHVYFKNKNNTYFPWELQLWDKKDMKSNVQSHRSHKRKFVLVRKNLKAIWSK